jgi:hypothetical protein
LNLACKLERDQFYVPFLPCLLLLLCLLCIRSEIVVNMGGDDLGSDLIKSSLWWTWMDDYRVFNFFFIYFDRYYERGQTLEILLKLCSTS